MAEFGRGSEGGHYTCVDHLALREADAYCVLFMEEVSPPGQGAAIHHHNDYFHNLEHYSNEDDDYWAVAELERVIGGGGSYGTLS